MIFVAARLSAFTQAHAQFIEAVERIHVAQAGIDHATALVRERSALHDMALGKLIAQLVVDAHPRINPLTSYSAVTPSGIAEMPEAARSTVVRESLGNVLRDERLFAGSRDAANACATAASARPRRRPHGLWVFRSFLGAAHGYRERRLSGLVVELGGALSRVKVAA